MASLTSNGGTIGKITNGSLIESRTEPMFIQNKTYFLQYSEYGSDHLIFMGGGGRAGRLLFNQQIFRYSQNIYIVVHGLFWSLFFEK